MDDMENKFNKVFGMLEELQEAGVQQKSQLIKPTEYNSDSNLRSKRLITNKLANVNDVISERFVNSSKIEKKVWSRKDSQASELSNGQFPSNIDLEKNNMNIPNKNISHFGNPDFNLNENGKLPLIKDNKFNKTILEDC